MKKQELGEKAGISAASIAKLGRDGNVTTAILAKICVALECETSNILELVLDEEEKKYEMTKWEDRKIPALVHFTRLSYTYMSIKDKQSCVDYDADTNIFYVPFYRCHQQNKWEKADDRGFKENHWRTEN